MALQKWAAPAGSPLLSTQTATGDPGNQVLRSFEQFYASSADTIVGATLKISTAGSLTTTGAPTASIALSAHGATLLVLVPTAAAGATGQLWTCEATVITRGFDSAGNMSIAYWYRIAGLSASDLTGVGTVISSSSGAFSSWTFNIGWDATADDADSGDIITVEAADALWIG